MECAELGLSSCKTYANPLSRRPALRPLRLPLPPPTRLRLLPLHRAKPCPLLRAPRHHRLLLSPVQPGPTRPVQAQLEAVRPLAAASKAMFRTSSAASRASGAESRSRSVRTLVELTLAGRPGALRAGWTVAPTWGSSGRVKPLRWGRAGPTYRKPAGPSTCL